jgi:acyl phosphate:glycerol-3-phosphate acyltransferase
MDYLIILLVFLFAFILGSIPTAYLIVKAVIGKDITQEGSKNCGATNARRVTNIYYGDNSKKGTAIFITVVVLDILKGALPVLLAVILFRNLHNRILADLIALGTAVFAVLGHDLMPFFKKGAGKGVATSAGAFFVLAPVPTFVVAVLFFLSGFITKTISRRSIVCAAIHPIVCIIVGLSLPIVAASLLLVTLLIYKHKDNIKRIISGVE